MSSRTKVVGVAWYRPGDWSRLREISADAHALEESHGKWLESANRIVRQLEQGSVRVRKVIVDLDELLAFCHASNIALDSKARSRFVAVKVQAEKTALE
jgi:hypothetical protein